MGLLDKILLLILLFIATWFATANLMFALLNLSHVLAEKRPRHRTLFQKFDDFWKSFWRRVL
jgi:hypothetical protein